MSAIAIAAGVVRHRPARRWPWGLLAGAFAVTAVATIFAGRSAASASTIDVSAPLGAALVVGALASAYAEWELLFRTIPPDNRDVAVDAVVVALVSGSVIMVFTGGPGGVLEDLNLVGGVWLLLVVAVFAVVLRIAFSGLLALPAVRCFLVMIVLLPIGVVWMLVQPEPHTARTVVVSVAVLCPGVAALSPSMRHLGQAADLPTRGGTTLSRTRIMLLRCGAGRGSPGRRIQSL